MNKAPIHRLSTCRKFQTRVQWLVFGLVQPWTMWQFRAICIRVCWAVTRLFNMPLYCKRCCDNDRLSTLCARGGIAT